MGRGFPPFSCWRPPHPILQALALAALHALEHCHLYTLDLAHLAADGSRSPQEACAHIIAEARRTTPAVVLLPAADAWLGCADGALVATLTLLLSQLPTAMPLLLLGTCNSHVDDLDPVVASALRHLFPHDYHELTPPRAEDREELLRRCALAIQTQITCRRGTCLLFVRTHAAACLSPGLLHTSNRISSRCQAGGRRLRADRRAAAHASAAAAAAPAVAARAADATARALR